MSDLANNQLKLRTYSSAEDLAEGDLKMVKERLETVGIEPSRLLAQWMKKSLGLELDIPQVNEEEGAAGSDRKESKEYQIERKKVIDGVIKRIRTELGPIAGVDPINAGGG